jgi:endonuclease VIII
VPEGDTIHRLALRLRPLLVGQRLIEIECELASVDDWKLIGREVARVEARGKNLLIHCAPLTVVDGKPDPRRPEQLPVAIWTHLGMLGAWRIQSAPVASRPPAVAGGPTGHADLDLRFAAVRSRDAARPSRAAALALHTTTHVAACHEPKHLAMLGPRSLLRHPMLARLGPDLLDPDADLDEAVARLRALGRVELGDAIMRQSAVAGIGNVYKSELLFLERLSPFVTIVELEPDRLRTLLERARALMQANVDAGGPRRTRGDLQAPRERLWVYERSGRPCQVCGTILAMRRQGELARSTYYCPRCQS